MKDVKSTDGLCSGAREKKKREFDKKKVLARLFPFYFAERFKVGVLAALHCSQPLPTLPRGNPHQHEAACVIPTPITSPHRARLTPEGPLSPPPTLPPPSRTKKKSNKNRPKFTASVATPFTHRDTLFLLPYPSTLLAFFKLTLYNLFFLLSHHGTRTIIPFF